MGMYKVQSSSAFSAFVSVTLFSSRSDAGSQLMSPIRNSHLTRVDEVDDMFSFDALYAAMKLPGNLGFWLHHFLYMQYHISSGHL